MKVKETLNLPTMKCKKYYSPFCPGGDNDFEVGNYYKVNISEGYARDSEGIYWNIDNIKDYFKKTNIFDKIILKLFYNI